MRCPRLVHEPNPGGKSRQGAGSNFMIGESYLVEIFLPLADNLGRGFPPAKFAEMAEELKRQFNGVTVHDRKPARGKTQDSSDDIIIFEVMTSDLDRAWWASYRARLEHEFEQDEILIRATRIEKL
jgi:hypothetical protein